MTYFKLKSRDRLRALRRALFSLCEQKCTSITARPFCLLIFYLKLRLRTYYTESQFAKNSTLYNICPCFQWKDEDEQNGNRSTLPPPMPPVAPAPRLRRVNSSTMSLGRTRKKILTVSKPFSKQKLLLVTCLSWTDKSGKMAQPLCLPFGSQCRHFLNLIFLQLEELYVEILYSILHMIGCDVEREEQTALIYHLKDAFHMDMDKHAQLLDIASMREVRWKKGLRLAMYVSRKRTSVRYGS